MCAGNPNARAVPIEMDGRPVHGTTAHLGIRSAGRFRLPSLRRDGAVLDAHRTDLTAPDSWKS